MVVPGQTPRVSIITALYNHQDFIEQAIVSVLSQTFQDFEFLIWDDGSKDQSLEIAKSYAVKYPDKIFVHTHPGRQNRGQEATRNEALKLVRGEYVCLLDSDDYWLPRKLELQVALMDQDPQVGLVYGATQVLIHNKNRLLTLPFQEPGHGDAFDALVGSNFILACSAMIRRQALAGGYVFETRYGAIGEFPLWLKIAHSWKLAAVHEPVAVWRKHGDNTGTKKRMQGRRELVDMVEGFWADSVYGRHREALENALLQYRYDLAVILLEEGTALERTEAAALFNKLIAGLRKAPGTAGNILLLKGFLMRTLALPGAALPLALLKVAKRIKMRSRCRRALAREPIVKK